MIPGAAYLWARYVGLPRMYKIIIPIGVVLMLVGVWLLMAGDDTTIEGLDLRPG